MTMMPTQNDEEILSRKTAMSRAEGAYQQTLLQSRILAAACFFIGSAIAVAAPTRLPGIMILLLGVALLVSGAAKWLAQRNFRLELERATEK